MANSEKCSKCGGIGKWLCRNCDGSKVNPKYYEQNGGALYICPECPDDSMVKCRFCGGSGFAKDEALFCNFCDGRGEVRCKECGGIGRIRIGTILLIFSRYESCATCSSCGMVACKDCLGKGRK